MQADAEQPAGDEQRHQQPHAVRTRTGRSQRMPRERNESAREQNDRHELQPVLDMADEEQFEAHTDDAHHEREE